MQRRLRCLKRNMEEFLQGSGSQKLNKAEISVLQDDPLKDLLSS